MKHLLPGILLLLVFQSTARSADGPAPPDPARVRELVRQLDDDRFATRARADAQLRKMGIGVVPLLRQPLAERPTLEVRKRLERIIGELASVPWRTDLGSAREAAGRAGKPLLVFSTIGEVGGFG